MAAGDVKRFLMKNKLTGCSPETGKQQMQIRKNKPGTLNHCKTNSIKQAGLLHTRRDDELTTGTGRKKN